MMQDFDYLAPRTLQEALESLSRHRGEANLLAGGTHLVYRMKAGDLAPRLVISLGKICGLQGIEEGDDGGLTIGACATLEEVARSSIVRRHYDLLAVAASQVGGPQTRNRGTIGGNICNASPAADTAPPLLVLGATLTVASARGQRTVPMSEFFVAPRRTVMSEDEILTAIHLPEALPRSGGAFLKLGRRKAMDISLVCAAGYISMQPGSMVVREGRVALGSVAPTPLLVKEVESAVNGSELTPEVLERAGQVAAERAQPITDIRASADYRREMAGVLAKRVLAKAHAKATGG